MTRRSALLVSALGIAALGTLLILLWVKGIEDRAKEDQELVEVLVATGTIEPGDTLEDALADGKIETREINSIAEVPGSMSTTESIEGQIALENIYPGEQILEQNWGAPGQEQTLGIEGDHMAISVELSDPDRVAGFVTAGSEIAVFCTALDAQVILPDGTTRDVGDYTRVIVPRALVLGIGNTAVASRTTTTDEGEQTSEEVPRTVLTLSVDQDDAEKIILCRQGSNPTFALLTEDSAVESKRPEGVGATPTDLFPELFRGPR